MADYTDLYDAQAGAYDRSRGSWRPASRAAAFAAAAPAGPLLDAGCGPGLDLGVLRGAGRDAVGVDRSRGMVAIAATRAPAVVGDLTALPFPDAHFSGLWVSASLVHLDDGQAAAALRELARVALPGALARITVKARRPGGPARGPEAAEEFGTGSARWFRWWDPTEFTDLVASSGFATATAAVEPDARREGLDWVAVTARR